MKPILATAVKFWTLLKMFGRQDTQGRFEFFSRYLWILLAILSYRYFFQATFALKTIRFGDHEIDFALFLISGFATVRFVGFAIRIFDDAIRMLRGTLLLEWVLVTPTSLWAFMASNVCWKAFVTVTEFVVAVVLAKFLIGTPCGAFFQVPILIVIFLTTVAYAGLGMILSALVLLVKRGSFLFPMFEQLSAFWGGAFFPVQLFPKGLHLFAQALPITPALELVRYFLIGVGGAEGAVLFLRLGLMAVFLFTFGAILLQISLVLSRRHGWLLT